MDIPGWRIGLDGSTATIGSRGGVALSWTVPGPDGDVELLDGYRDAAERSAGDGARQALLVPWSNRIRGSRYSWGGRDYDLGPDPRGLRGALHGLALDAGFELVERTDSRLKLRTTLSHAEYPQDLRVHAVYQLGHTVRRDGVDEWSLHLTLDARNLGGFDTPVGLGWHPYVRWIGGARGACVHVPARLHVDTDAALVPLPGSAAFRTAGGGDVDGVVIEDPAGLDDAWTGLLVRSDGVARTVLDHASGARTVLEADTRLDDTAHGPGTLPGRPGIGIVQLFTGEPLAHRAGQSLAMEYCQFMTDAYNRPDLTGALRLAPGATRALHARLVHTF